MAIALAKNLKCIDEELRQNVPLRKIPKLIEEKDQKVQKSDAGLEIWSNYETNTTVTFTSLNFL
jgi:ribosome-binding factor A